MRYFLPLLVLLGWLVAPLPVSAGEREEALALIDKAIKVHGGEDALNKAQQAVRKGSGVLTVAGQELPFNDVVHMSLPDKVRLNVELEKRGNVLTVINGEQGWQRAGGAVNELGKEIRVEMREEAYIWWLTTLVPLKKPGFVLGLAPDEKVDGKPAAGIKVKNRGYREVRMFFDKASGRLVKVAGAARLAGVVVDKEYYYSGHKEFGGALLYTKSTEIIGGRKNSELKSATYELRKPEDSLFNRP